MCSVKKEMKEKDRETVIRVFFSSSSAMEMSESRRRCWNSCENNRYVPRAALEYYDDFIHLINDSWPIHFCSFTFQREQYGWNTIDLHLPLIYSPRPWFIVLWQNVEEWNASTVAIHTHTHTLRLQQIIVLQNIINFMQKLQQFHRRDRRRHIQISYRSLYPSVFDLWLIANAEDTMFVKY